MSGFEPRRVDPDPQWRLLGVIGSPRMRHPWTAQLAVALGLGLLAGTEAMAQPPRDRAAAEGFVDSIADLTDREALRVLERGLMLRAKRDRSNPGLHLRLGALALKLGEVNDASAEFKWATQLDPRWAAAWFGLGRAELALGELADTTKLGRRALLARDAWNRATAAFARAVTIDSSWALKAETLVVNRAGSASASVVREGLRRAASGPTRNAVAMLALGRVERMLGDSGAALVAFDRAGGLPGGRGLGLLEAARTRLARGDPRGVDDYFAAAAVDDTAAVGLLRSELRWIATADELNRFDVSRGDGRAGLLRRLWTGRDRADLRQDGERLREHARRLAAARALYPNPDDQRVAVLVRHGEPDSRAAARPPEAPPNESWRYRWPEGEVIVHFVAGADTTNYRVVESLFDLLPDPDGRTAADERPAGAPDLVDILLRSRAQLSPFYQSAAAGRRDQLANFRAREREIGRASRNLALTTDRFPLRFERDLAARIRILSGGVGSAPALELAFAIPGFVFDSSRAAIPARYETRVRLTIWDSTQTAVGVDTVLTTVLDKPVEAGSAVTGVASVALPSGTYSVRAVLEAAARGTAASRDGVAVGSAPGEPRLSDLAVGVTGAGAVLGLGRPIDPAAVFRRSDTVIVSAVLFAGEPGPLRVRFLLRPVSGTGTEAKWKGFPGRSGWMTTEADGNAVIGLSLPLRGVKPGPHELEAIVVDRRGVEVRKRTRIEVTESSR